MTTKQRVDFVDISHHQDYRIDHAAAAKAGVRGIYHKATEGDSFTDTAYRRRRAEAAKARMPFGAYHFARAEPGDADDEARRFLAVAKPKPGDLVPALDLETTEGLSRPELTTWARTFSEIVKREVGVLPVLYCPWDLGLPNLRWVPRYNDSGTPPTIRWDAWQFSNGVLGVPDRVAGFPGPTDLNVLAKGVPWSRFLLATSTPVKQPRRKIRLRLAHVSMQFSDTPKQMEADARRIFERAVKRSYAWITGTEAGAGADPLRSLLRKYAAAAGYRFWMDPQTDAWYAVRADLIDGGWDTWSGPVVVPGKAGKHTAKKATSVSWDNRELGRMSVIAAHYLTKGRPGSRDPLYAVHVPQNTALSAAICDRAKVLGKGSAKVWYGGDQNIVDRGQGADNDTFFGGPLTSAWDELGKWENTGHGNIDVIASYDGDGAVEAVGARALDDREFQLHTDHYLIEAEYDVEVLKSAA